MRDRTRSTIYFSTEIFKALRMKAAATHRTISEMVNEAVKDTLAEDAIDLDAIKLLRDDSTTSFESFVSGLRRRGTL
jgi:predicted transcriptional regulator